MNYRVGCAAIVVAISVVALVFLIHLSNLYPFYWIWDMDHLTTLDMLLINSGRLPDHINHTSLGMYLMMRVTSVIATKLSLVSASSLNVLADALNPLLPLAEYSTFLRLHSPFVILATALTTFGSVVLLSGVRACSLTGAVVLVVLLSEQWMIYHATLIRSEVYAVFFWQLAILAITAAAHLRQMPAQALLAILSGGLAGLGLITKFQLFPYLVAYYAIVKMVADTHQTEFAAQSENYIRHSGVFLAANVAALLIFAALWLLASRQELSPNYFVVSNVAGERVSYGLSIFALFFAGAGVLVLVLQILHRRVAFVQRLIGAHDLALFSAIQLGYACAAVAGMLIFTDVATGWSYTIAVFKVAYLRQFTALGFDTTMDIMRSNAREFAAYYRVLLSVMGFALLCNLVLAFIVRESRDRRTLLQTTFWTCTVLLVFFIGSVFFRFFVRDMIWHESLPTFMTVLLLCVASGTVRRSWQDLSGQWAVTVVSVIPLLVLIGSNLASYSTLRLKTDLNYNIYGWSPHNAFFHVYGGNHLFFRRIIQRHFLDERIAPDSLAGIAFRHAVEWSAIQRTANFVLPYQSVPLTRIGVFSPGGFVAADDEKLTVVPAQMQGSILVDLNGLPSQRARLIDAKQVSEESEAFDKITRVRVRGRAAVIPRTDLNIILFSPVGGELCDLAASTAKSDKTVLTYCGQSIKEYTEIDLARGRPGFLVIRPRYGW